MGDPSDDRDPVEMLAEEFAARQRRGERPSIEEYAARHPELADDIRDLFPALRMMEDLGDGSLGRLTTDGPPAPPPELQRLGDYRILRQVGRGGMGVVYEAEQESLGRRVALKVLPPQALLDAHQLRRFEREARAAARLHHTNIVPVFGVGCHEGTHYYVMQFIQGLGLDEVLGELRRLRQAKVPTQVGDGGPPAATLSPSAAGVAHALMSGQFSKHAAPPEPRRMPEKASGSHAGSSSSVVLPGQSGGELSESGRQYWLSVARIGTQVAEALDYANSQGLLHRDVKPSNLLLDMHGTVWVTDFGLAKAAGEGEALTQTGDIVGTIRYMAPERFSGAGDARSDVYSLGLTLYELLVQQPAFDETDRHRLMKQVAQAEPPPPRKLNPAIPRDLETVVLKAVARDPAHRYQTAAELADDLKRFVDDRPILARRVSAAERFVRWCKRNPTVAGLAAALLLVLLVGNALVVWKWRAAEHAEALQAQARHEADGAAGRERDEARKADEARRRAEGLLGEQFVGQGVRLLERGDVSGAALCFAEALRRDQGDPERARTHRIRLTSTLRQAPRPRFALFHPAVVQHAAFSPDGRRLVTAAEGAAQVYDVATGRPLGEPLPHDGTVSRVAFNADGSRVLTWCYRARAGALEGEPTESPYTARVWDVAARTAVSLPDWGIARSEPGPDTAPRYLVTFTREGAARVWDATTGRPVGPALAHPRPVSEWHLSEAGRRLLTVVREQPFAGPAGRPAGPAGTRRTPAPDEVRVWDVATGQVLRLPPSANRGGGPRSRGRSASFSPDGARVALVDSDGVLQVCDARTGKKCFSCARPRRTCVFFDFSADGRRLLGLFAGGAFREEAAAVQVLDAVTGQPFGAAFEAGVTLRTPYLSALLSPDGGRALIENRDGVPELWDGATGRRVGPVAAAGAEVEQVRFSPDGRYVLTVGGGNAARVWDTLSGKPATPALEHGSPVTQAAFSPDGSHVLTVSGNAVRLWPLAPAAPRQATLPGGPANQFYLSADGRRVLAAGAGMAQDGRRFVRVQVYEAATGRAVAGPVELPVEGPTAANGPAVFRGQSLAFSPDGLRVLCWSSGTSPFGQLATGAPAPCRCLLWDAERGQVHALELAAKGLAVAASFSDDGRFIRTTCVPSRPATPDGQGEAESRLWGATTGQALGPALAHRYAPTRRGGAPGGFRGVVSTPAGSYAWAPDGGRLATVEPTEGGNEVRLRDARTGRDLSPPLRLEGEGLIAAAVFSADGHRLLLSGEAADRTGTVTRVWAAATGAPVSPTLRLAVGGSSPLVLSPRGDRLAAVVRDSLQRFTVVQVLDVTTGRAVTTPLPHEQTVLSAQFGPDGSRVLTLSADGVARLWDAATGELLRVFKQDLRLSAARFSADGRRVVTFNLVGQLSPDVQVQVWDAATGQPLSPPLLTRSGRFSGGLPVAGPTALANQGRDADRLLLQGEAGEVIVYDLSADDRPADDLRALAEVLSGRHVNAAGGLQALEAGRFERAWQASHRQGPDDWGPPALEGLAWHRRQANEVPSVLRPGSFASRARGEDTAAFARLWHLDRLLAVEKDAPDHLAGRAQAHLELGELDRAVADLSRAIAGQRDELRPLRGDVYARLGRWQEAEADLAWRPAGGRPETPPGLLGPAPAVPLALVRLHLGDEAGYARACAELAEQLLATRDRNAARPGIRTTLTVTYFRRAWPLALAPAGTAALNRVAPEAGEDDLGGPFASPLFPLDLGAALEYRRGHFDRAEKRLKAQLQRRPDARPIDCFFLAMAQAKGGRPAEARRSLAEGVQRQEQREADGERDGVPSALVGTIYPSAWQRRLAEQIVRREAERTVAAEAKR